MRFSVVKTTNNHQESRDTILQWHTQGAEVVLVQQRHWYCHVFVFNAKCRNSRYFANSIQL